MGQRGKHVATSGSYRVIGSGSGDGDDRHASQMISSAVTKIHVDNISWKQWGEIDTQDKEAPRCLVGKGSREAIPGEF